ncbi:MAG: phage holin family protein [Burkholderiaceae bacterium]
MDTAPHLGLLGSARAVLAGLVEIGHTRLQLASTEFEEERLRIAQLLLYATAALFFLGLGLVLFALWLVLLFWDSHRVFVLGAETTLILSIGAALAGVWRHKARTKPRFLGTTLTELQRDREALQTGTAPPP